jgi:RNA polymerase sigma-70 factor (ECF subfamily)
MVCAPSDASSDDGPPRSFQRGRRAHDEFDGAAWDAAQDATQSDVTARAAHSLVEIGGVAVSALLSRLRVDDRDALATLYVALRVPMWRLAMILVRSADVADEIVQNVFVALWMRRHALSVDTDLSAYLNTAVRNAARQFGRHGKVVDRVVSAIEQSTIELPAHGGGTVLPDVAAEHDDFLRAYQRALGTLAERERTALALRWEEERTFEEIGTVLGLSKVGARTVVMRAEGKVRALLAEYRT